MLRGLLEKLSGRQITALAFAAMFIPGAVGATIVFQAVAIVDPKTGVKTSVDAHGRLYVLDPIAGLTNNPLNIVNITKAASTDDNLGPIYTPPAGKALLIKSVQFNYYGNTEGNDIWWYGYSAASGSSKFAFDGAKVADTLTAVFEAPVVVKAGDSLGVDFKSEAATPAKHGILQIQGYLVPASVIPAGASTLEAEQFVQSGSRRKK